MAKEKNRPANVRFRKFRYQDNGRTGAKSVHLEMRYVRADGAVVIETPKRNGRFYPLPIRDGVAEWEGSNTAKNVIDLVFLLHDRNDDPVGVPVSCRRSPGKYLQSVHAKATGKEITRVAITRIEERRYEDKERPSVSILEVSFEQFDYTDHTGDARRVKVKLSNANGFVEHEKPTTREGDVRTATFLAAEFEGETDDITSVSVKGLTQGGANLATYESAKFHTVTAPPGYFLRMAWGETTEIQGKYHNEVVGLDGETELVVDPVADEAAPENPST